MLKIITDEESTCVYSIKSCSYDFDDAYVSNNMPYDNSTEHSTEWRTDITYYIKCKDIYGNMPSYSSCTMIVHAYDIE